MPAYIHSRKATVPALGPASAEAGNGRHFLKGCRWVGCTWHLFMTHVAPSPPSAVCHILDRAVALPLALERGNGSVQTFTSTALRLTESIKEDRPPRSPCAHPFSFLSALSICPNYFCLGCQRRFLAKGDRAEINSEHVGSSLFACQFSVNWWDHTNSSIINLISASLLIYYAA